MALGFSWIVFLAKVVGVLDDVNGNRFYIVVLSEDPRAGCGTEMAEIPVILLPSTREQEGILQVALETKRLVMGDGIFLPPFLDEDREPPAGYASVWLTSVAFVKIRIQNKGGWHVVRGFEEA